jgi:hypothetical protein
MGLLAMLGMAKAPVPAPHPVQMYSTFYSWWDNTPPGSPEISNPVIHTVADGDGSWANPVTVAVGHSIINGRDILDFAPGIKFYVPNIRKYLIVEDTCGDGPTPQNGPCHTNVDEPGYPQIDIWLDGRTDTANNHKKSNDCMDKLTRVGLVVTNPRNNYAVVKGSVYGGCGKQYGDAIVTA